MSKQQVIIDILRRELDHANDMYRETYAEFIGRKASLKAWDETNQDDGVGSHSQNPYRGISQGKYMSAKENADRIKLAYDFAVATFIAATGKSDDYAK